jgi:hypothetical protein
MNGRRREGWSWGRSEGMSGRCTQFRGGDCCRSRNRDRIRGKHWPSYPGDGRNSDNAEVRMQIPEVRIP